MRAFVDEDTCVGCGLCVTAAPDVFEIDNEGKSHAVADTTSGNRQSVLEAIEGCPVGAIREEE